jgi:hypothetical protein
MDLKRKKKKENLTSITLSTQQPSGQLSLSPQRPAFPLPFLFLLSRSHRAPTCRRLLLLPPPLSFLCSARMRAAAAPAVLAPLLPRSFHLLLAFMAINHHAPLLPQLPYRYSAPPPVMSAGHLWQAAGRRTIPLPLPLFLHFYLRLSPSSYPPLCTHITPSRARAPHTPSAAAPASAAAGRARRQ